ncbi:MAG: site-2 protease family protein [Opitutaceae bacterium]
MLRWSIKLFRVRGIQLSLHSSFVLLIAYYGYAGYEEARMPGLCWAIALLLAFFSCVVLHELGHSLTARRFGVGVRRILLMPIGGMAEFDSIPREPRKELLITVAGPAVNFVIAGLLWAALSGLRATVDVSDVPANLRQFFWTLAYINLGLGVFNLIPVFPMDGGRILRAVLAWRMNYVRATFWAVTIAKILACAAVLGVILGFFWGAIPEFNAWLYGILFLFIFTVGEMEYRAVRMRDRQEAELAQWAARMAAARAAAGYPPHPGVSFPNEPPLLGRN